MFVVCRTRPAPRRRDIDTSPFIDDYFRLEVEDRVGQVYHPTTEAVPVYNEAGTNALIQFELEYAGGGFCVFDFGDPSATFGVTMSWDISIDRPTWIDDGDDMLNGQYFDDDDYYNDYNDNFGNEYDEYARKNFVAMLVVNYETCVWRRVFITGPDGSYSASYSEEVCAAPRKYIRWVSFTGHPSELNAEAEVRVAREPRDDSSAAGSDDGSEGSGDGEGAGHCDADTVVPRVLFLSDSEEWVSSEAQERSPDVRLDGTNYWLLNNDDNSRHFLRSAAGRITKGHCHPRPQGGPVKQRGAPPDAMYAAGTYPS